MIRSVLRDFIKSLLLLLLSYAACRFAFILTHQQQLQIQSFFPFLQLMIYGIRFDLSAILLTNLPFLLVLILPLPFRHTRAFQNGLIALLMLVNGFFLLLNVVDIAYFPYVQNRMQFDAFRFVTGEKGTEFYHLLPNFLLQFWYLWLGFLFLLALLYKGLRHTFQNLESFEFHLRNLAYTILLLVLATAFTIIGIRGGLQKRPLSIIHASEMCSALHIPAVLNSPYSVLTTYDKKRLPDLQFYPDAEMTGIYSGIRKESTGNDFQKMNVVIIIIESMSKEHLGMFNGKSNTPFLDSLLSNSLLFPNAMANARVSIQGIPAILASIPSWQDDPFIFSPYATNRITSLAGLLKKEGYHTSFFHGGSSGTMGFNYFSNLAGFDQYHGRESFNNEKEYDGEWGIWDEPFLQYMAKELHQTPTPFLSAVFTLNPHHPFNIPATYRDRFKQAGHPIQTSIRYTDYALEQFFRTISRESWYANTLFVITADHTAPITEDKKLTALNEYRIPIAFYKPDGSMRGTNPTLISQIDIMPTLLGILQYPHPFFAFGTNALSANHSHLSVNYKNGIYQHIDTQYCLQHNGEFPVALYRWQEDSFFTNNLLYAGQNKELAYPREKSLKKYIQFFNQAMIHNRMEWNPTAKTNP